MESVNEGQTNGQQAPPVTHMAHPFSLVDSWVEQGHAHKGTFSQWLLSARCRYL